MAIVRKVLVVGGGTAGWLTATYLAHALGAAKPGGIAVELVESPDISIVGVGEGTFPSIRGTLSTIGLDENKFIARANATFKQGIRFEHWARAPGAPGRDHYLHPFSAPSQRPGAPELLPYWLLGYAPKELAFAEAVTMQKRVTDAGRGPKRLSDGPWQAPLNHAYHFDAARFADALSEHGQRELGVVRRAATIERVELDQAGAIACVHTREQGALSADLYVDCTGFRSLLCGQALGMGWRSAKDVLFNDRAWAMQVPYERKDTPIPSFTIARAHEAGWTWDIGLHERRGVGYVFSSRHTDETRAEQVLRDYLGKAADGLTAKLIKFEAGHRTAPWHKNCVAVGLAGGFVEPLESTGIALIEIAAYLIAHLFPADGDTTAVSKTFNAMMAARYERIFDFIKLHYCLSQRRDTPFWIDNVDAASIPQTLQDKLAMWRCRPPHRLDFISDLEMFLPASWQYVLYGMEFRTDLSAMRDVYDQVESARREFAAVQHVAGLALDDLPAHRTLVEAMARDYETQRDRIPQTA